MAEIRAGRAAGVASVSSRHDFRSRMRRKAPSRVVAICPASGTAARGASRCKPSGAIEGSGRVGAGVVAANSNSSSASPRARRRVRATRWREDKRRNGWASNSRLKHDTAPVKSGACRPNGPHSAKRVRDAREPPASVSAPISTEV